MDGQKFSATFADQLNKLDLAFEVLAAGLQSLNATSTWTLTHENSHGKVAKVEVFSECESFDARAAIGTAGGGHILWHTSSDHQVKFTFTLQDEGIVLERVDIGNDASNWLYPELVEKCVTNNIGIYQNGRGLTGVADLAPATKQSSDNLVLQLDEKTLAKLQH